jgi:hypothetical protein
LALLLLALRSQRSAERREAFFSGADKSKIEHFCVKSGLIARKKAARAAAQIRVLESQLARHQSHASV